MAKIKSKGFTLVELIIVITILAILSTIAFVSFQSYTKNTRDSNRLTSIRNISKGLDLYFVQNTKYPTPDETITLTGNSNIYLNQGKIGNNVGSIIGLNNLYKDPKTGESLNYSTTSNGRYYQLGTNLENNSLSFFSNKAFADNIGLKIEGNYKFDPSLPSLFTVNNSVTSSGIFDPNVCFIYEGGDDNFESNNNNCTKKKDIELKDIDSGLVGYWDMESLSGSLLKDLSGNGNHGTFSGGMVYEDSLTGGIVGNSLYFDGLIDMIEVPSSSLLNINNDKDFSIFITIKPSILQNDVSNPYDYITILDNSNGIPGSNFPYGIHLLTQENILPYRVTGSVFDGVNLPSVLSPLSILDNYYDKFISVTFTRKGTELFLYINGNLVDTISDTTSSDTINIVSTLNIGFGKYGVTKYTGIIDELKIYNRALSDQEILQQAKIAGF